MLVLHLGDVAVKFAYLGELLGRLQTAQFVKRVADKGDVIPAASCAANTLSMVMGQRPFQNG